MCNVASQVKQIRFENYPLLVWHLFEDRKRECKIELWAPAALASCITFFFKFYFASFLRQAWQFLT
jgi:hypothetical protein